MPDKILLAFVGFDLAFLICAALHLIIPLMTEAAVKNTPTAGNVASTLLLDHCPLTATMVAAILMFCTFLVSLPALYRKTDRLFLNTHTWGVVASATLSLIIGLDIWFSTLQTHHNLGSLWNQQSAQVQSLLQSKFKCCGYDDPSLFVKDSVCSSTATAARLGGCEVPFGVFANKFLDIVFTTFFAFVAVDAMLLLAGLCLIKDRKEKYRYKLIDEKRGNGPI